MLRKQFDDWIPFASPLRNLATKIAQLEAAIWPDFLARTGSEPLNVLANAELADSWRQPSSFTRKALLLWKGGPAGLHGFASKSKRSPRGLALVFDPFVDAFLAAHFATGGKLESDCTVLVLTDYYPSASITSPSIDWAKTETESLLEGRIRGRNSTTPQLFNALFGKDGWRGQRAQITEGIRSRKLLLWNFLPMFRGGEVPTGGSGLPPAGNWRLKCWELLAEFLVAVRASRTVLASSQAMLPFHGNLAGILTNEQLLVPGIDGPLPSLPCARGVYRIFHPSSWKRMRNDGPLLSRILSE